MPMVARAERRLHPIRQEVAVRAGAVVMRQGEPSPPMRVVTHGAFVEELLRDDGRRLVLDVIGPGEGIGGSGDERIAQATVRALKPGRLREPAPDEDVAVLTRRAERATRLAAELAWSDVQARLTSRLHALADRFGHPVPGGFAIGLALTHDELADLCGTTRESVTRAMRQLVRQGLVDVPRRGRIVVRHGPSAAPSCNRIRLHEPQ